MKLHAMHVGRVTHASSGELTAILPDAPLGAIICIHRGDMPALYAEVIAIREERVTLAPWSDPHGVYVGATATMVGDRPPSLTLDGVGGRVLNPHGIDIYDGSDLRCSTPTLLSTSFASRIASKEALRTGLRSIDMLLPLVRGQRVGVFAGAGVGKTTLLTQLAQQVEASRVIIILIGERGREAVALANELQALDMWERTTLIVSTSEDPAALRNRAAWAGMELAQRARANGEHVLLLVDSLTRWVRAKRDLALQAGERAARAGFPPSAFAAMAPLIEAAGAQKQGSITALFTVLLEADAMEDPIGDEARGLVEAHWILERRLAQRGIFPAIHVPSSLSRLAKDALNEPQYVVHQRLREAYAALDELQEAERFGLYQQGNDPKLDRIYPLQDALWQFLQQGQNERAPWEQTQAQALELFHALEAPLSEHRL